MNERKRKIITIATICTIITLLFVSLSIFPNDNLTQQEIKLEKATFVLSGWDYPDSYGQGIYYLAVYGNSTGSWVWESPTVYSTDPTITFSWNSSVGIKIRVYTWLNNTLVGADDIADGRNYHRHTISVVDELDNSIWGKNNITYYLDEDTQDPMYFYAYEVILGFVPQSGKTYTTSILYEIYY